MADTITLIEKDDDAARILDAFEEETGLEPDLGEEGTRIYTLSGDDHQVAIVRTLTEIDDDWGEHVAVGDPA